MYITKCLAKLCAEQDTYTNNNQNYHDAPFFGAGFNFSTKMRDVLLVISNSDPKLFISRQILDPFRKNHINKMGNRSFLKSIGKCKIKMQISCHGTCVERQN